MKLYSTDGSEMMEVTKIEPDALRLLVSGTLMGAMPVQIAVTGPELRKLLGMLNWRIIATAVRLLFKR